jgi:hypothetical protein
VGGKPKRKDLKQQHRWFELKHQQAAPRFERPETALARTKEILRREARR